MALSTQFHWFRADDDVTTEYSERFNVDRFPTLLVMNAKEQCIDRWREYLEPQHFTTRLHRARDRAKHDPAGDDATYYPFARRWGTEFMPDRGGLAGAISDEAEMPQGLVRHKGEWWAAALDQGWRYKPDEQMWDLACSIPLNTADIASDGTHLYALERGWPGGKPIHVIDPETDETERTVTADRQVGLGHGSATGIAWLKGKLWVLEGDVARLHRVDPATGKIEFTAAVQARSCTGLAVDGDLLVSADLDHIVWIQPSTGLTMRTYAIPRGFRLKSLAMQDGVLHCLEEPVEVYTKDHELTWPLPKTTRVLTIDTRTSRK